MDVNRLIKADCITGLREVDAESVDLVFADPPFNIGYEYDVYHDQRDAEQYLEWTRRWGQAICRVLSPVGTFWLAIGDDYAAELKLLFQNELGFSCRSWVIWYYTFGVNCTKKFSRSHTHLFHFVRDPKKFTFNAPPIKVPSARQLVYADDRAKEGGRLPDDTWILRPQDLSDGFQPNEDAWYFRRVCGTFKERAGWHGCQMPEQLLGRILRSCSNPQDLVLDPFAGSGTTLVVAKKLGRRYLGFEISPNYVTRTQTRLDAAAEQQPLQGEVELAGGAPPTRFGRALGSPTSNVITSRGRDSIDLDQGILAAFFAVRDGYSPDRIIADPDLNDRFLDTCRRLGIPGRAKDWNTRLMNLRKASHLKGLPASRRSSFRRAEIDICSYACEIALTQLKTSGLSLDQILCEPDEAREFDKVVRTMVSAEVSSYMIRWIALYLRKRAHKYRSKEHRLRRFEPLPKDAVPVESLRWDRVPLSSGLYWLQSPTKKLYIGETLNLQQRFRLQLEMNSFTFWNTPRHDLEIRFCELPNSDKVLIGNRARWIREWNPIGNDPDLAAI